MDKLKRNRSILRATFTKTVNVLKTELAKSVSDLQKGLLLDKLTKLENTYEDLKVLNENILQLLLETNASDVELTNEIEDTEKYSDEFITMKRVVNEAVTHVFSPGENESVSSALNGATNSKHYKLPKLNISEYDGSLINYLTFWSQFKKIHTDKDLEDCDKFQYLLQSVKANTRARELLESYPLTSENYITAVTAFQDRFGKKELLIEVYVRELLKLIISNVRANGKDRLPLPDLFMKVEAYLRSLESMGLNAEANSAWLYPMVESSLPEDVLRAWQRSSLASVNNIQDSKESDSDNTSKSNLSRLMKFLKGEVEGEERICLVRQGFGLERQKKNVFTKTSTDNNIPTAAGLLSSYKKHVGWKGNTTCIFCENKHNLEDCKSFKKIPFEEKRNFLKKKGCCFICLRTGHTYQICKNPLRCSKCSKRHRAVMCPDFNSNFSNQQEANTIKTDHSDENDSKDHILSNKICTQDVLLQTLKVFLRGKDNEIVIRALIDTGSQKSYLRTDTAHAMGYMPLGEQKVNHCLFGGIEAMETHRTYRVFLTSLCRDYKCNFEVFDQKKICSDIQSVRNGPWIEELNHHRISLSDYVNENKNKQSVDEEIHLLIGADIAGKLLTGNIRQLSDGLVAVHTRLGWTLMGKLPSEVKQSETLAALSLFCNETKVSDLWNLDVLGITDLSEKQTNIELEEAAKEHFLKSLTRNNEGRYEVSLPWVQSQQTLQNNLRIAERRLRSTVKTLQSNGYLSAYEEVFKEWLEEEIIELVDTSEKDNPECHYLPHRAVIKTEATTKIRPVFDASAKEKNCFSLNDCLEKGPNFIGLISIILNKFRLRKYGVIADIRRAFLQISVKMNDRDYLRFLWWEEGNPENLRIFRHRRVVFGVNSSPFLLGATLHYHIENVPAHLQVIAEKLQESMYVDNCVTSLDSVEDLNNFIEKSREIMSAGKFDLRGWVFNKPKPDFSLKKGMNITDSSTFHSQTAETQEEIVSVLGLKWNVFDDTLSCDLKDINDFCDKPVTKRIILSSANKIFDPIGFLSPVSLVPKVLMQECWREKLSWDTELPNNLAKKFRKWHNRLDVLKDVSIPRRIIYHFDSETKLSFHVFCDASQISYATCIYLRAKNGTEISCRFMQARSRVAPLKTVSIPRLELLACCIGARLINSIKRDLHFEQVPTFYWSDSMNAIYWIKNQEPWATFVMNRVKEIRTLSHPDEWNHVPGHSNPADLPSRGCSPDALILQQWWEGPNWLLDSEEKWPMYEISPCTEIVNAEKKKIIVTNMDQVHLESENFYSRFSSYIRILRVTAWIYRFYSNLKVKDSRTQGNLTVKEIRHSEFILMKLIQKEQFPKGIDARIRSLHPFIDEKGLIRVKTQIFQRKDKKNFRMPILLPAEHYIVHKLIAWKHIELKHAGVQILMNNLRENYWILRSRKTIRRVLQQCIQCRRFTAPSSQVESPPLPEDRVRNATVFEITGVDLAGPLFLKGGQKCWIVLYTCAVYRAIHLELISSLSTEAFFQSLRRFIARRGRPFIIYSDNGTNFVGASNALSEIDWTNLLSEVNLKGITWKFIPPASPWWGGWWERLVAMIKHTLRRVLGQASLHYEELYTLLCDTESLLNSRPLTYLSEDIEDLIPLTPNMFLHEPKEVGVPEMDNIDKISLHKRYSYLQKVREDLRKRFRSEYLGQLKYSNKQENNGPVISVGDIVLIGCDNQKRFQWPLARVMEVYPGRDGLVRVAKVKTKSGELIRPVQRLYPLEMTTHEGSNLQDKLLTKSSAHERQEDLELNDESSDSLDKRFDKKSSLKTRQLSADDPPLVTSRCGRSVKPPKRLNL